MTYYVFLILALAVAGAGCLVLRRSEFWGRLLVGAGCIGCLVCIGWRVRETVFAPEPKGPDRAQAVVAYFLAEHVLSEVGNQQGMVVLLFPPESVFDQETVGTYAGTFSRVLRGFPGLKVQVQTLTAPAKAARAGRIPLSAFQQVISNAPPALVYVSFAGVPAGLESLWPSDSQRAPGFFAFDPWATTNWLGALKAQRVRAVIVRRPDIPRTAGDEVAGEPSEVFNRLYLMATPANAEQIAMKLGAK